MGKIFLTEMTEIMAMEVLEASNEQAPSFLRKN